MSRIFLALSSVAILLLVGNLVLGLVGEDYNGHSARLREARAEWAAADQRGNRELAVSLQTKADLAYQAFLPLQKNVRFHILAGVLAALMTVLVHSIGVTYFIGTGRWCKEVSTAYQLDNDFDLRFRRVKRRSFPWALLGMATVVGITSLGAAADPGTLRETTQQWVQPHGWSAILGVGVIAVALWMQYLTIQQNQALIEQVVAAVQDERRRRGIDE